MTVGELLDRIDSRELTEWQAYEQVAGPIGPGRDDLHAAIIAATIANLRRTKNQQPAKVADFLPEWHRRPQTPHDQQVILRALASRPDPS